MSAIRSISASVRELTCATESPMPLRYALLITRTGNVLSHVSIYACASGRVGQDTISPTEKKYFQTSGSLSLHMGYQRLLAGSAIIVYCTCISFLWQKVHADVLLHPLQKIRIGLCQRRRNPGHVLIS